MPVNSGKLLVEWRRAIASSHLPRIDQVVPVGNDVAERTAATTRVRVRAERALPQSMQREAWPWSTARRGTTSMHLLEVTDPLLLVAVGEGSSTSLRGIAVGLPISSVRFARAPPAIVLVSGRRRVPARDPPGRMGRSALHLGERRLVLLAGRPSRTSAHRSPTCGARRRRARCACTREVPPQQALDVPPRRSSSSSRVEVDRLGVALASRGSRPPRRARRR